MSRNSQDHHDHKHGDGHHDHDHDHDHAHPHSHVSHTHVAQHKLKQAMLLALGVLAVEVIGGFWANSLALLSDAGHMLTDVASLIAAFWAVKLSTNPPSSSMTYGYHRITIIAALINAVTLFANALYIGEEAYQRMLDPQPVRGTVLFIAAAIGLLVNLYIGLGMREHADNVNIKSAMLHVMGDAAASAGVIAAGVIMYFTEWYILDPILSVLIAVIVALGAFRVLRECFNVLMEGTPPSVDFDSVIQTLLSIPGVRDVHDLHIWCLTSNRNAMSAHLVVDGGLSVKDSQSILQKIESEISNRHGIGHMTVQLEDGSQPHEHDMFGIDKAWKH